MKIRSVRANNRRRAFEVATKAVTYAMPYARVDPAPAPDDPVASVFVDEELGREGFTYTLRSGAEGSVHLDAVFDYNEDPSYMRDVLLYRLTLEARRCVETSGLSRREIIRRMGTSPAQFYRLLDPSNRRKTVDRMLVLLAVVGCHVDLTVTDAAHGVSARP